MAIAPALELVALVTVLASEGAVHSAVSHQFAAFSAGHWAAVVHGQIVPVEIGARSPQPAGWCWRGPTDHGHRWARAGVFSLCSLTVFGKRLQ